MRGFADFVLIFLLMGKDSQSLLLLAGNCTHLPYIIWEQQPLLPDLMPFMPFLLWYQLEIDFETEARG